MRTTRRAVLAACAGLACALTLATSAQAADALSVSVDRVQISARLGQTVAFRSTIRNRGTSPATGLIAHLNILSLRNGVYVDPEDWSSSRTRYLAAVPAGGSTTLRWEIKAVNAGQLGVYVSVLRESAVGDRPVNGPAVHVAVAQRKTLNSGGVLPLALGIPALLGAVSLTALFRRRG